MLKSVYKASFVTQNTGRKGQGTHAKLLTYYTVTIATHSDSRGHVDTQIQSDHLTK